MFTVDYQSANQERLHLPRRTDSRSARGCVEGASVHWWTSLPCAIFRQQTNLVSSYHLAYKFRTVEMIRHGLKIKTCFGLNSYLHKLYYQLSSDFKEMWITLGSEGKPRILLSRSRIIKIVLWTEKDLSPFHTCVNNEIKGYSLARSSLPLRFC